MVTKYKLIEGWNYKVLISTSGTNQRMSKSILIFGKCQIDDPCVFIFKIGEKFYNLDLYLLYYVYLFININMYLYKIFINYIYNF